MSIEEYVPIPSPEDKRLLHPTDIPEARRLYVRGWWFERLASLPIAVMIGSAMWLTTGSLAAALLAPTTTLVIGMIVGSQLRKRSWDFIPRKRQLRETPHRWALLGAALDGLALVAAATLLTISITIRPLPEGVLAFAVGAAAGVAVVQIIELVAVGTRREPGQTAQRLILLTAVLASIAVAAFLLADPAAALSEKEGLAVVAGAATVLIAQSAWALARVVARRRSERPASEDGVLTDGEERG